MGALGGQEGRRTVGPWKARRELRCPGAGVSGSQELAEQSRALGTLLGPFAAAACVLSIAEPTPQSLSCFLA